MQISRRRTTGGIRTQTQPSSRTLDAQQEAPNEAPSVVYVERPAQGSPGSMLLTLLVFAGAIGFVRYTMPSLVEEVHYSMQRGKQRANYELSGEQLRDDPLSNLSNASQLVAQRIAPSVVHIDTRRVPSPMESMAHSGEAPSDREVHGQGSGVIVDSAGLVLTNFHVIDAAEQITVTLSDDRELEAQVVGVSGKRDLALLRIPADEPLTAAQWGDSDLLHEGAMVWAAGSPFGLSKTITFGILSSTGRRSVDKGREHRFLQSDAAVSAGNSGGPLVNAQGQLVGINTAIMGSTYQGVSFAIPSNTARDVVQELLEQPTPPTGWLGVRLANRPGTSGAEVTRLVGHSESPARKAGMVAGDVIMRWNDISVDSSRELIDLLSKAEVDTQVQLRILRDGQPKEIRVAIGSRPLQFQ